MTSVDRWMLPEGVDELLPERAAVAEQLRRNILDLLKSWGYQLVVPPLIEFTDSLLIGMGKDIETQSFRLTDQISGKSMAVCADITPQTARMDAHSLKAEGIRRLCYAGSVLHTRPKTLMASRCPMQIGAELYGDASISADIEVISLLLETLHLIESEFTSAQGNASKGLCKLTLDLGHVSIYNAVRDAIKTAAPELEQDDLALIFDAIQRKSLPDLKCLLPRLLAGHAITETLYQLPSLCGGANVLVKAKVLLGSLGQGVVDAIDQLTQVAEIISQRFTAVEVYFDLAEIRGYEYHTGLVFAAYADGHGLALANGGRYDNIGKVFGSERSATGFNTDIKALIDFLGSRATLAVQPINAEREIIAAPNSDETSLWNAVSQLRSAGEIVIFNGEAGTETPTSLLVQKAGNWVVEKIK